MGGLAWISKYTRLGPWPIVFVTCAVGGLNREGIFATFFGGRAGFSGGTVRPTALGTGGEGDGSGWRRRGPRQRRRDARAGWKVKGDILS